MKIVLMSIRPKFSRRIFDGDKRFELRRTPVRLEPGDIVVVYESAPSKAVVGAFTVNKVRRGEVQGLWREYGPHFGVSHEEYRSYFDGTDEGHAIEVGKVIEVDPVPLEELRERVSGFRPPQSYMFWTEALEGLLGGSAAQAIRAM